MLSVKRNRGVSVRVLAVASAALIALGALNVPQAHAAPPDPSTVGPDQIALVWQVNGDRNPDGSIGTVPGATFSLQYGSTPLTGSWTTCTVDADGYCSFIGSIADLPYGGLYYIAVAPVLQSAPSGWSAVSQYGSSMPAIFLTNASALGGQVITATSPIVMERDNPALSTSCGQAGLNVAIDVDLSGSMAGQPLADLQTAAKSFVDALTGTNSKIALFTFASTAPASGATNVTRPLTSVASSAGAAQVKSWIDGWAIGDLTNWDAGLSQVATSGETYDIVIFITDGGPNESSSGNIFADNVASANAVKASGARIMAVLVGPSADAASVPFISGTVTGDPDPALNDYFTSTWTDISNALHSITMVCPAIVGEVVNVVYVDDGNGGATVTPAGGAVTTLRGSDGDAVTFTEADAKAGVPAGYQYVSLDNVAFFDSDPSVNQTITVHLTKMPSSPSTTTPPPPSTTTPPPTSVQPVAAGGPTSITGGGVGSPPIGPVLAVPALAMIAALAVELFRRRRAHVEA